MLYWLILCSRWISLVPLLVWLFNYEKYNKVQKLLGLQLGLAIVIESLSSYLARRDNNNMPIYHLYVVFEMIIFSIVFRALLNDIIRRRTMIIITSLFSALAILNCCYLQPIDKLPTFTRALESLVIVSFSLVGFYKLFTEMKVRSLEKNFEFWIYSGTLLYFSGNLFLFILSNTILVDNSEKHKLVWTIVHSSFNIILYLSLAIALWYGSGGGHKRLFYPFRRYSRDVPSGHRDHSLRGDLPEETDPPSA
jgi:hypothetical protein